MEPLSPGRSQIIYEGFLHKTPPLDKLFVSWKRRWFVLSRTDPINPGAVELSYYTDPMKQEKKRSFPLSRVVKIHPTFSKAKDHSFAVELPEHKFLLRAPDGTSKNVWVAKLCEFSGQDQSFHVTVPYQPAAAAAEASLKLAFLKAVLVVSPSTGKPVMEIPFGRIRRLGYEMIYGSDIVWFESCECNGQMQEDFHYFIVKSGMAAAYQIINEIKAKIEAATGAFLILEKSEDTEVAYKARAHYGHKDYPSVIRARILQAGLGGLNHSWPMMAGAGIGRRQSEFSHHATNAAAEQGRRKTIQAALGIGVNSRTPSPAYSPRLGGRTTSPYSPSPSPTTSPNHSGNKMTLDQMTGYARMPRSTKSPQGSKSEQFDSGVTLDAFDEARHSAPSYVPMTAAPSVQKDLTKPRTSPPPTRRPILQHGRTIDVVERRAPIVPSRRITLADHLNSREQTRNGSKVSLPRTFPSKDSSLGTSADLEVDGEYEVLTSPNAPISSRAYDHLPERTRRLSPAVPPRSTQSLRRDSPYVES